MLCFGYPSTITSLGETLTSDSKKIYNHVIVDHRVVIHVIKYQVHYPALDEFQSQDPIILSVSHIFVVKFGYSFLF